MDTIQALSESNRQAMVDRWTIWLVIQGIHPGDGKGCL